MKAIYGLLILSVFLFVSCSKENKQTDETNSTTTDQSTVEMNKRYQIKSGIVTYQISNNLMQGKMTSILYFDDFGAKESRETITEFSMMGQTIKSHKLNFAKEGYLYDLDLDKKTGSRIKGMLPKGSEYDVSKFSENMMKEYNVKKEGTEEVVGKTCEKISMENQKSNMKGTVYNWQGITLKSDVDMGKINVKTVATKIEENASVPSSKFEIPADIKIQESDFQMNKMK